MHYIMYFMLMCNTNKTQKMEMICEIFLRSIILLVYILLLIKSKKFIQLPVKLVYDQQK